MEKQRSQAGSADPVPLEIAEPAPERVVARVESFMRLNRSNRIRITLDNGQIWQETDGPRFRGSVMPGAEVTISKGRFRGYRMKVPGRSAAILVRRIK